MKTKDQLKEEIKLLKEDLRQADAYFLTCSNKLHAAETEVDELKQRLKDIEEDGTEEHNAIFNLRKQIVQSRLESDEWKKVARQLYSVALHLQAVANSRCNIVVVGPGLYSEAVESIKEYENLDKSNS